MRLYKIEFGFTTKKGEDLVGAQWAGTQADAKDAEKKLMAGTAYDVEVEQEDVPTDKAGLLTWLNTFAAGDASRYEG